MTFRYVTVAILAGLTLPVSAANATLLNFTDIKAPRGNTWIYGPYVDPTGDYKISASNCSSSRNGPHCFNSTVTKGISGIDFGTDSTGMGNQVGSSTTTLTRVDGAAFELASILFAPSSSNKLGYGAATVGIDFTFTFADGRSPLSETLLINNTAGLDVSKTLLDFSSYGELTAISWKPGRGAGGFLQFDNINVSLPAAAPVPEPATWAMMLGGFGLIGGTMRNARRRTAIRFA